MNINDIANLDIGGTEPTPPTIITSKARGLADTRSQHGQGEAIHVQEGSGRGFGVTAGNTFSITHQDGEQGTLSPTGFQDMVRAHALDYDIAEYAVTPFVPHGHAPGLTRILPGLGDDSDDSDDSDGDKNAKKAKPHDPLAAASPFTPVSMRILQAEWPDGRFPSRTLASAGQRRVTVSPLALARTGDLLVSDLRGNGFDFRAERAYSRDGLTVTLQSTGPIIATPRDGQRLRLTMGLGVDGSRSIVIGGSGIEIVCTNTERAAYFQAMTGELGGGRTKHVGDVTRKLAGLYADFLGFVQAVNAKGHWERAADGVTFTADEMLALGLRVAYVMTLNNVKKATAFLESGSDVPSEKATGRVMTYAEQMLADFQDHKKGAHGSTLYDAKMAITRWTSRDQAGDGAGIRGASRSSTTVDPLTGETFPIPAVASAADGLAFGNGAWTRAQDFGWLALDVAGQQHDIESVKEIVLAADSERLEWL